jgi:hypothetical protein
VDILLHACGKFVDSPQKPHTDIVFLEERHLFAQIFAQERHQEVDFRLWPPPIFHRKRVKRQRFNFQSRARFNCYPRRLRSRAVSRNPRQVPLLRPPPVAIHNHCNVPGQPRQI